MESKVEAVLAGKKSSFPADMDEEKDATASATASPAALFAILAPPLSLLRHVACLCAGYLGLKLPAPAPASSSSTSAAAAAAACQINEVEAPAASEDCTEAEVVLEVRSRGRARPSKPKFKPPRQTRDLPVQSEKGRRGGENH